MENLCDKYINLITNSVSMAEKKEKIENSMAVLALILNILIIPGLGSIIGKRITEGIWQLILTIGGFVLGFVFMFLVIIEPMMMILGFFFMFLGPLAGWIWGLVTGIDLIRESNS